MTSEAGGHRHNCALCDAITECVDPDCKPPYLCQICFDKGAALLRKASGDISALVGSKLRVQRGAIHLAFQALSSIQEIVQLTLRELEQSRSLWDDEEA